MAKILMITHSPVPDNRVDREARALKEAGHKLFLIYPEKNGEIKDHYEKNFQINLKNLT